MTNLLVAAFLSVIILGAAGVFIGILHLITNLPVRWSEVAFWAFMTILTFGYSLLVVWGF